MNELALFAITCDLVFALCIYAAMVAHPYLVTLIKREKITKARGQFPPKPAPFKNAPEPPNVQIEARRAFAPSLSNAGLDTGKDDAP